MTTESIHREGKRCAEGKLPEPETKKARTDEGQSQLPPCAFPAELVARFLSFSSAADVGKAALVCREWNVAAKDDVLWKQLFQRDFGECSESTNFRKAYQIEQLQQRQMILRSNIANAQYDHTILQKKDGMRFLEFYYCDGKIVSLSFLENKEDETGQGDFDLIQGQDGDFSSEDIRFLIGDSAQPIAEETDGTKYSQACSNLLIEGSGDAPPVGDEEDIVSEDETVTYLDGTFYWEHWDVRTEKILFQRFACEDGELIAACAANNFFLPNLSNPCIVDVFSMATGMQIGTLEGHSCPIDEILVAGEKIITLSICEEDPQMELGDQTALTIWDASNGKCISSESWQINSETAKEVLYSCKYSNGKLLTFHIAQDEDIQTFPVRIWDPNTGKILAIFKEAIVHAGVFGSTTCSTDRFFSFNPEKNGVDVWDLENMEYIFSIPLVKPKGDVPLVNWTQCIGSLLLVGIDFRVYAFDSKTGQESHIFLGDEESGEDLLFLHADNDYLMTCASNTGFITIWDLYTGKRLSEICILNDARNALYHKGNLILRNILDNTIEVLNFNPRQQ